MGAVADFFLFVRDLTGLSSVVSGVVVVVAMVGWDASDRFLLVPAILLVIALISFIVGDIAEGGRP